jgi:hypothetical protein
MNAKPYCTVSSLVFLVVAAAHAVRAFRGLPLIIGGWSLPVAVSWLVAAGAGLLAYWGSRLAMRD